MKQTEKCTKCGYRLPKLKVLAMVPKQISSEVEGTMVVLCCTNCGKSYHFIADAIPVLVESWEEC
ncbi:MAG: hypothetical protein HZA83_00205 [Thaumarchaeota archaeon]|nr:hypothetical protein [Nitrososphaerota archaeon]